MGVCEHHQELYDNVKSMVETQEKVNGTLEKVNAALGDGKVNFATLKTRLSLVEKIVYGAVGLILTGFVAAVLVLVFK